MSGSMFSLVVFVSFIASDRLLSASDVKKFQWPENTNENVDGFWFGTQSLSCMNSKTGSRPRLSRRSIIITRGGSPSIASGFPRRSNLRYIHRLVFYRGTTFEWGTGVQGYHFGHGASVRDCPVTWEGSPAGESRCPVSKVMNFTLGYRSRFGPYNLLTNNCHHYANRISRLLTTEDECGRGESPSEGTDDGVVSGGEKTLWSIVNYFLSFGRKPTTTPEPEIEMSQIIT